MKTLLIVATLLVFAIGAAAQAPLHKATLNWVATPDALSNPSITANIYRADGKCPATGLPTGPALIGSTLAGATTYMDTNVSVAKTYCWFVVAILNGVESVGSNTAGAEIPLAPYTGLTVGAQ